MKFTNVKQLIIKFMGGGIINFPTRFLRWVKINGDSDDSDGGGSSSDVFFVPATIQPKYFVNNDDTQPIEIKNYTPADSTLFLYNKEDIISLGVNEEDLNNLNIFGLEDAYNDVDNNSHSNGLLISGNNFDNKTILASIITTVNGNKIPNIYGIRECYIYKISDNIFVMIEGALINPGHGPIGPIS